MKKIFSLITMLAFFSMGCATPQAYNSYLDAKKAQIAAERKPLIELALDKDGKLASLAVYPAPQQIDIQQEKDHPGYAVANSLIKMSGFVAGIFAIGNVVEKVGDAAQGTTTNINSANDNSSNTGNLDQSYGITDTVTTTTDNSTQ